MPRSLSNSTTSGRIGCCRLHPGLDFVKLLPLSVSRRQSHATQVHPLAAPRRRTISGMHPRLPSATPGAVLLVLFVAIVLAACSNSSSVTGPKDGKVRPGIWGGDHVGVTVTETGSTLEYDCAAGTIDQPFVLDAP